MRGSYKKPCTATYLELRKRQARAHAHATIVPGSKHRITSCIACVPALVCPGKTSYTDICTQHERRGRALQHRHGEKKGPKLNKCRIGSAVESFSIPPTSGGARSFRLLRTVESLLQRDGQATSGPKGSHPRMLIAPHRRLRQCKVRKEPHCRDDPLYFG